MRSLLSRFDQQTGLVTSLGNWFQRPLAGGPAWRYVWPATIAFTFLVQAITGLAIWMYYSPGPQSSWESVYYLQYHVLGGWLLRAVHFYTGQATLVLIGVYLVQMVLRAAYAPPRTLLFWTVLCMGLVALGLNLTGDLLPWDQNSYWATGIRVSYLSHTPLAGPWLSKLAMGGPQFGTFTLTRFLVLHIGAFSVALAGLILLHARLAARHGLETSSAKGDSPIFVETKIGTVPVPYWPRQAWRDAFACLVVLAVILGLSLRNGASGPHAGIELGAPANAVDDPGTARPEWSFRGLYQLHESLAAWPEMVSIMIIPGLTVLVFFAMPWIGRSRVGRVLNAVIALSVLCGLAVLTRHSYRADATNEKYQTALEAGREQAERARELIVRPSAEEIEKGKLASETPRIPVSGALTLLQNDPKTQGPRLFNQHCASCHDYSGPAAGGIFRPEKPTAADLNGFGRRSWLVEFLTVKGIASPKFFGNTKFKRSKMYGFVRETFSDFEDKDKQQIIAALSHEAELESPAEATTASQNDIAAGAKLIRENCTDCHSFHGKGTFSGPELTGYGSRRWLIGMIGDPAQKRFYGKKNDRMPAFCESASEPHKNVLSQHDLELLVDWLRGEW
jgi:ubiquinol-cytochrome c reductase cytochrome b subunit